MIYDVDVYVKQEDLDNVELDVLPVYMHDEPKFLAYIARKHWERHLKCKMLERAFRQMAELTFYDKDGNIMNSTSSEHVHAVVID